MGIKLSSYQRLRVREILIRGKEGLTWDNVTVPCFCSGDRKFVVIPDSGLKKSILWLCLGDHMYC